MSETAVYIRNLLFGFPGSLYIYKDFSLEIKKGEFWGILGKNGAGKSTLLDIISGVRTPLAGEIKLHKDFTSPTSRIYHLSHSSETNYNWTIKEFLYFHSLFYPNFSSSEEKRLLSLFKVNVAKKMNELSTGQRKQIQAIACFASSPKMILVDELTAVLDPDARTLFFELLKEFKSAGGTIILATNIREDLQGRVDKLFNIDEKKHE